MVIIFKFKIKFKAVIKIKQLVGEHPFAVKALIIDNLFLGKKKKKKPLGLSALVQDMAGKLQEVTGHHMVRSMENMGKSEVL